MDTAEKWDKSAADYQRTYKLGQSDYSSAMLRFWERQGMLKNGMRVLDIGCGVGKYGVCFAERGCDVTLTDISGGMLRHAAENMSGFDVPWRVYQCDFNEISGTEPVFSGGFDFSISTMSPAVHDADTVRKMSAMTDGWCFLTRFIQWKQPNRDRLLLSLGLEPKPMMENMKEDCAALVRAISGEGYVPLVKYVDYSWSDQRTPEQAAEYMLRNYMDGPEAPDAEKVLQAARGLCDENGSFTDAVDTRVMWIYWNTKKGE